MLRLSFLSLASLALVLSTGCAARQTVDPCACIAQGNAQGYASGQSGWNGAATGSGQSGWNGAASGTPTAGWSGSGTGTSTAGWNGT
ncbi:MAG: hypothetical protein EOO75_21610, partial [Myxococcales bacterium]